MSDLINTIESPGEFDALATLRPAEPYFLLVGRDTIAPTLVDSWADTNRRRTIADHEAGKIDQATLERELRKSTQAEIIGCEMRAFKAGHPADPVEEARETKTSYSGHELPPETAARDRETRVRAKAASLVNNAVAELSDLETGLMDIGALPEWAALTDIVDDLRKLASQVVPARPGIDKTSTLAPEEIVEPNQENA